MASNSLLSGLIVAVVTISILASAEAATNHKVGGSFGWGIPQSNPNLYTTWAAGQTFALGDTLEFNFPTNAHDVIQLKSKSDYDSCNSANKIGSVLTTGPANVTLNTSGPNYFICGFGTHCAQGMKLSITVGASAPGASPAPPAASTPDASPAPPGSVVQPGTLTPPSDGGNSGSASLSAAAGFSLAVAVVTVASAFIF